MKKERIQRIIRKYSERAKKYLDDREKTAKLLNSAENKLDKVDSENGPLETIISDIKLLFSALNDWIKGNYRKFPTGSILMIIVAILYFVTLVDFIPDFIIGAGYLDDAAVISFVLKQVHADLMAYKGWKESRKNQIR